MLVLPVALQAVDGAEPEVADLAPVAFLGVVDEVNVRLEQVPVDEKLLAQTTREQSATHF